MKEKKGFTLIEVMIVVVIVAILAAVAVPSYQESVRKTKRAEAKEALTRIAAAQERFFFTNNGYTDDLSLLGYSGGVSENGYYNIDLTGGNGPSDRIHCTSGTTTYPCFTIQAGAATGRSQFKDEKCRTFLITHTGKKSAADAQGRDSTAECW